MGDAFWATTNLKMASCASAMGCKIRDDDPITVVVSESGHRQATFWFYVDENSKVVRDNFERPWGKLELEKEHPLVYIRSALENRETLLALLKQAQPMLTINRGGKTLFVSENASPELKRKVLNEL